MDAPAMTLVLLAAFAAGALLGAAHFGSLWWSVVLMRDGRTALGVAVQALRFAALAVALALIAREGAATLPRRGARAPGDPRPSRAALSEARVKSP